MVCLGLEPGAAGWKAQTNPLSYGGTHSNPFMFDRFSCYLPRKFLLLHLSRKIIKSVHIGKNSLAKCTSTKQAVCQTGDGHSVLWVLQIPSFDLDQRTLTYFVGEVSLYCKPPVRFVCTKLLSLC